MLELAKRFGKRPVFAIFGLVLFGVIGFPILAFGKAQYQDEFAPDNQSSVPSTSPQASPPIAPSTEQPVPIPPAPMSPSGNSTPPSNPVQ